MHVDEGHVNNVCFLTDLHNSKKKEKKNSEQHCPKHYSVVERVRSIENTLENIQRTFSKLRWMISGKPSQKMYFCQDIPFLSVPT
jgi:hypothetical protein